MFKCLFVFFLLIAVTEQLMDPFLYPDCAAVGNGFTDIGGSCYKVIEVNANNREARALCKAHHPNADLATIRCDQENQGVYSLAVSGGVMSSCKAVYNSQKDRSHNYWRSQMWIGLMDPNHRIDGGYWANGAANTHIHLQKWSPGEPNNQRKAETATEMYIFDREDERAPDWNDVDPDLVTCAAACEVLTAKSGSACGMVPCPKEQTSVIRDTSSCLAYYDRDCDAVGNGFTSSGYSCYKVIEAHANFNEARKLCRAQHPNADLATIRCENENQGVYDLTRGDLVTACEAYYIHNQHDPLSYYQSQMWIGLYDPSSAREGSWVSGDVLGYRNWSEDPNNSRNQSGMATQMFLFEQYHSQWIKIDPNTVMCAAACEVYTRETSFAYDC